MELIVKPLADAVVSLETNLGLISSPAAAADLKVAAAFRTAAIKSFEYTYEIAIKLLLRAIENHPGQSEATVDDLSFNGMLRRAYEFGFIDRVDTWQTYRIKRNKTSHTYNEATAGEVLAVLPAFLLSAKFTLTKLEAVSDVS